MPAHRVRKWWQVRSSGCAPRVKAALWGLHRGSAWQMQGVCSSVVCPNKCIYAHAFWHSPWLSISLRKRSGHRQCARFDANAWVTCAAQDGGAPPWQV